MPEAGQTHDLVVYLNNSTLLGVIFKPNTFRVDVAPRFIPRFAVGDPRGIDETRWKSWVQARFDGGAGQIYLSAARGNNRYAESHLVDIGLPITALGGLAGRADPVTQAAQDQAALDDDPVGDITVALRPRSTSLEGPYTSSHPGAPTLWTTQRPLFVLEYSNRPHAFHWLSQMVYTNLTGVDVFGGRRGPLEIADALTGEWAVMNTNVGGIIVDAVKFSGVIVLALNSGSGSGISIYGAASGPTRSTLYTPHYSTEADRLGVYDRKLWKASSGRVSFLEPLVDSVRWSAYSQVGDPSIPVNKIREAFGRLYFGKQDSIWVFEQGRFYSVETYSDQRDPTNFNLMVMHRGQLYYNIRNKVYRISSGNLIELLATPNITGAITDGTSSGSELHIMYQEPSGDSKVLIFDPETGGSRVWFSSEDIMQRVQGPLAGQVLARGPTSIKSAFGYLWIAPTFLSADYRTGAAWPIIAANRINPAQAQNIPYFARTYSWIVLSMTDFGLPNIVKELRRVVTDRTIRNTGERIDVYYNVDLFDAAPINIEIDDAGFTDYTTQLTNGSVAAADGEMDQTTVGAADVYFGFTRPINMMKVVVGPNAAAATPGNWQYWNGTDWITLLSSTAVLGEGIGVVVDNTRFLAQDGIVYVGDVSETWRPSNPGTGTSAYYLRLQHTSGNVRINLVEVTGLNGLLQQNWTLLGSMTDRTVRQEVLNFPIPTTAENIMLMYRLRGSDISTPDIKRVEIEYLDINFPHRTLHGVVMAFDKLETLQLGVVENSALLIQQSLYSMAMSGLTHVIQAPPIKSVFPTGNSAQYTTFRAQVQIVAPGGAFPIMAYTDSLPDAEIPIRIEEM